MTSITLSEYKKFHGELNKLQERYGIYLYADTNDEYDENSDGNYVVINSEPCISYKDSEGNGISEYSLKENKEKQKLINSRYLIITENEDKLRKKVDEIFDGEKYESKISKYLDVKDFWNERISICSHSLDIGGISGYTYGHILLDENLIYTKHFINKCENVWLDEKSKYEVQTF